MLAIRHLWCPPHHPETDSKLERFHETLNVRLDLLVYPSPDDLLVTIPESVDFQSRRCHIEGIGSATRADGRL